MSLFVHAVLTSYLYCMVICLVWQQQLQALFHQGQAHGENRITMCQHPFTLWWKYGQNMRPLDKRVNKLKRKRKETAEKANSTASTADGWVKPSMGKSPDNAVVRATGTPPPELPKNQESVLGSLITTPMQNSRRVQTKHQDSPKLVYIKSKDKTKDSGKKQPRKLNSSSSAVNTTPSPEKTVSENTHIHKSRARALWVRNKNPRTESSCDAGVYSYEVSENYYESFSQ
ncbi:uncharacterized protein LOC117882196 isoform X2 [Trachemys scripta elegans]|uniref:uncharacterized protein LOC117882196 isoform X2 n=1 Tax=Trachemys scripta elegans TaxID=31138 RepID=UPI001555B88A|nr:uncharacterized protein LOC117882196 isoform X2 [Trachemys scripta elegans]